MVMTPLRMLALCIAASPAAADCPTAADLAGGIRAVISDGGQEVYRTIGQNRVEVKNDYGDGYITTVLLAHGVYVLEVSETENGRPVPDSRSVTRYPVALDKLPLPAPGASWKVEVQVTDANGTSAEQETHRWDQVSSYTRDGCTYDALSGTIRYDYDDGWYQEELLYFSEMGIAVLVASDDSDAGPVTFAPYASFQVVQD